MSSRTKPNKKPYISCIKINGVPILPPLIVTNEERQELLKYKYEAISIENRLIRDSDNRTPTLSNPVHLIESKKVHSVLSSKSSLHGHPLSETSKTNVPNNKKKLGRKNTTSPCRSPKCNKLKKKSLVKKSSSTSTVPSVADDKPHCEVFDFLENSNNTTPKKTQHVRRNSYTLESPTPEILEHLCALQDKNNQRLHKDSLQVSDMNHLSSSSQLQTEKFKCLKNLNQLNFQPEEYHASKSYHSQEKTFLENLPKNFFQMNENVLSESRTELCEINKLNNSIELASHLLKSINTNSTSETHRESLSDNAVLNSNSTNTKDAVFSEGETTVFTSINHTVPSSFVSKESDVRSELSNSTITNLEFPKNSESCELNSPTESVTANRHRRVWNLKQAKHLWENEELVIPDKQYHSEPSSMRSSPDMYLRPILSCSLSCLGAPFSKDPLDLPTPSAKDNLEKPSACLERSIDTLGTSAEEDLNLYAYYLNLYKDMSEYVSQQGELLSPQIMSEPKAVPLKQTPNTQHQIQQDTKQDSENLERREIRESFDSENRSDEQNFEHSERSNYVFASGSDNTVYESNWTPSQSNYLQDGLQFAKLTQSEDDDFDLEIPDNLDDIEQFLRDLQHSQEQEMALLLRKQQEEQLWLKQRQQRLKDSVLSVSSRSSSQQSSLNSSLMSSLAEGDQINTGTVQYNECSSNDHLAENNATDTECILNPPTSKGSKPMMTKEMHNYHERNRNPLLETNTTCPKPTFSNASDNADNREYKCDVRNITSGFTLMALNDGDGHQIEKKVIEKNGACEDSKKGETNELELINTCHHQSQSLQVPNRHKDISASNKSIGSNKSTPSQHYESCEEWFTPEAEVKLLSPTSREDNDEDVINREHTNAEYSNLLHIHGKTTNRTKPMMTEEIINSHERHSNPLLEIKTRREDIEEMSSNFKQAENSEDTKYSLTINQNPLQAKNKSSHSKRSDIESALDEKSKASIEEYMRQWTGISICSDLSKKKDTMYPFRNENNTQGGQEQRVKPVQHNRSVGVLRDILNTPYSMEQDKPLVGDLEWKKFVWKESVKSFEERTRRHSVNEREAEKEIETGRNNLEGREEEQVLAIVGKTRLAQEEYAVRELHSLADSEQQVNESKVKVRDGATWEQWNEELNASKMKETSYNSNEKDELILQNPTFSELFGTDESSKSSETGSLGHVEFSPETQAKLVNILGKDWSQELMSRERVNPNQLPSFHSHHAIPRPLELPATMSSTTPNSVIPIMSSDLYDVKTNCSLLAKTEQSNVFVDNTGSPIPDTPPTGNGSSPPSKDVLQFPDCSNVLSLPVESRNSDSLQSSERVNFQMNPKMDSPETGNQSSLTSSPAESPESRSSLENLSRTSPGRLSLESLKQKYLLRPNVKRTSGLAEFESNVMNRLHREASARPKTIIKPEYTEREKAAAVTLTAAGRGFLIRRLLRTQRVQHIKDTIQDTLQCAMSLQSDPTTLSPMDLELHTRLIQQLTAACYELYDTFFSLSTSEKLHIISVDRERLKNVKLAQQMKAEKRPSISSLTRLKRAQPATQSEPKNSSTMAGAVKVNRKPVTICGSKVRRSRSVSSQDAASSKSSESVQSAGALYRVSRSQSSTLDKKAPSIRRRLVLI
uniref:Centriolar coiled-coil protein of 110 kDa n=1 Tax=Cacopsylla melanoneura TaxID=428564 RepID=A0A8D9ACR9_9HEMI